MNFFDQFGGAFGAAGLGVMLLFAFSSPLSLIEKAARFTARFGLSYMLLVWLACVAEEASR